VFFPSVINPAEGPRLPLAGALHCRLRISEKAVYEPSSAGLALLHYLPLPAKSDGPGV
jgi:hypothetical protein